MTDSRQNPTPKGNQSNDINHPGQYDVKLIEAILRPVNNANDQIERVWRTYKYLASALALIIAFGLAVFYFLFANNVDSLTKQVQLRVDAELQTPRIQKIIRSEVISRLSSDEIDSIIRQGTLEMQQFYKVFRIFNDLDNDNIDSYDELHRIATSSDFKFKDIQQLAKDMLKTFDNKMTYNEFIKHLDVQGSYAFASFSNEIGSDPSTWTYDDFNTKYYLIDSTFHPHCVAFLWFQDKKFSLFDRLQFLYRVVKEDKNLWAIYVACALINREAKIDKAYLSERTEYLKWWDEHKNSYLEPQK